MPNITVLCRTATTFSKTKELDEGALRKFLQRFVDNKLGVYLGSGGSGEGHALSRDELRRVYTIGVQVCKGKVPVNANPPEQHTAQATCEHTMLAIEAGIEVVNVYGPDSRHGFRPTDAEFIAYFDEVLSAIKHPVALAPNPTIGYLPKPDLIAAVCRKYPQVVAVNLAGMAGLVDNYIIALKDMINRDIQYYVEILGSLNSLDLGAAGFCDHEPNIIPKTYRQYIDLYESKKFDELSIVYAHIRRMIKYVSEWRPATPRWLKMAMKVLRLPGGEGGLRGPYRMPSDDELERFTQGLLRLHVPEIDEMARAAGLRLPT